MQSVAWNHLGSWIPGTHQLVAMEFFHIDGKSHQFKDNISTSWGEIGSWNHSVLCFRTCMHAVT